MFLVRKGNPKGIKDWDDLVEARRRGDHAEPEDLGRRALELPRGLGLRAAASPAATRRRRRTSSRGSSRTCRCSTPARAARRRPSSSAASATCCSPGRTRRSSRVKELGAGQVRDRRAVAVSILAEPPVAVVDKVVDKRGTREVAEAYLEFLYTDGGAGDRRASTTTARASPKVAAKYAQQFPKVELFTIDEVFGGWAKAHARRTSPTAASSTRSTSRAVKSSVATPVLRAAQRTASLPGFGLTLGFTLLYLGADRADPALGGCSSRRPRSTWDAVLATRSPRRARSRRYRLSASAPSLVAAADQRRLRPARRVGAGALPLPGPAPRRRARRPAVRAADRGRRASRSPRSTRRTAGSARCSRRSASRSRSRRSASLVALTFIGLPFVVRTVQPVLEDLERELEEAAATLGASALADLPRA